VGASSPCTVCLWTGNRYIDKSINKVPKTPRKRATPLPFFFFLFRKKVKASRVILSIYSLSFHDLDRPDFDVDPNSRQPAAFCVCGFVVVYIYIYIYILDSVSGGHAIQMEIH